MDGFSQPLEDRKVVKGIMRTGAFVSLIIGLTIMIFFIDKVMESHSIPQEGQILNFEHWGAFGDFIAGVAGTLFSLGGFFLLYLTLQDQRENFHKERLESNFFEMVRFHRENVDELQFTYYESMDKDSKETAVKRKVFKLIILHFKEAWGELQHFFADGKEETIYQKEYLEKNKKNPKLLGRTINLVQLAQIDIIYHIIFFGLSQEDKQTILKRLERKYNSTFVNNVLTYASLKPKKESVYWGNWKQTADLENKIAIFQEILKKRANPAYEPTEILTGWIVEGDRYYSYRAFYPDNYDKYYGGHQFRLGHYYRHMYAAVNFIDREKYLSQEEKYFYIKILRVQLSNYEQIALFLNTISGLGRAWELEGDSTLVSTYNLITNIPSISVINDINTRDYYPNVQYEHGMS